MTVFRTYLFAACMSLAWSCSTHAQDVVILDGYSDFRSPGPLIVDRPMNVVLDDITAFPEFFGETSPLLELKSYFEDAGKFVVDVMETGLLDDSVKSLNRRFVFVPTENGKFKVWGYGYRQQCYRGGDPNEWVTDACL